MPDFVPLNFDKVRIIYKEPDEKKSRVISHKCYFLDLQRQFCKGDKSFSSAFALIYHIPTLVNVFLWDLG